MLNLALSLLALTLPSSGIDAPQPTLAQDSRPAQKEAAKPDKKSEVTLPNSKDSDDPALTKMAEFIKKSAIDKSKMTWKSRLPKPPLLTFSKDKEYHWNLETNKGVIQIRLMPDVAPMHVSSTIFLTRVGFYDELTFHRVITKFMAQGGCPSGTGTGGPGYKYAGEYDAKVKHDRPGLLSMANAGPGTDGSQFFLTFVATPWLDGKHTLFGEIIKGMETMTALENCGSQSGKTTEPLKLIKSTISVHDKPKKMEEASDKKPAEKKDK